MKSMTGFGTGEAASGGLRIRVEISSVNRKQSDVVINLPREWTALELEARKLVSARVSRGRVVVQVHAEREKSAVPTLRVDTELARQYTQSLRTLARELKLEGPVTPADLLRAPGVFQSGEAHDNAEQVWPHVEKVILCAMDSLDKSRAREGAHLKKDLESRLKQIRALLKSIVAAAPEVTGIHRKNLQKRLADAGFPLPLDDDRLLKEIAIFADRSDISEETTRLGGHLDEMARLLKSVEPAGRAMDFLTQEMNRELNTMGAKANNTAIAHLVVAGKTEVERIREQVQNIE